jgi:hypothetical protein
MKKMMPKPRALALFAGGAVVVTASAANAATQDCTALTNTVYIAGGSAAKPHLLALAQVLGSSVNLIYSAPTACIGLADVVTTPPQTESSSASWLDPTTGKAITCTAAGGTPYPPIYVDIGVSGAYPSSCITPTITLGSGYQDFQGPIEAFEISVPWASSQTAISADAAYVVFGWGGEGTYTVTPWTTPADVWTRGVTSAVQLIIGDAIGLTASKWLTNTGDAGLAQVLSSESTMVTTLVAGGTTAPDPTIGILGSGSLDPAKGAPVTSMGVTTGGLKPLAFQAGKQDCGYYADSNLSTFDKINVRQGRYDIWGPEHFVTAVDGSGNPVASPQASGNPVVSTNANVQTVIAYITHAASGDLPFPAATALTETELQNVIAAESNAFFIPQCSMQVKRTTEVGPEASFQPKEGCGCYFESLTGKGTTLSSYCKTCTTAATDCTDKAYPACNFGYCEAQ